MRSFPIVLAIGLLSLSAFASEITKNDKDFLDCIDYGHSPMPPEKVAACQNKPSKKEKDLSAAALMKVALANPTVKAVLQATAKEAGMTPKQCSVQALSAKEYSNEQDMLEGEVKIYQVCSDTKGEFGIITTIEAFVYGKAAYMTSAKVDRAG